MLKSPESIQRQLSDAISIIGREDFPEKWKDLLGVCDYQLETFTEICPQSALDKLWID